MSGLVAVTFAITWAVLACTLWLGYQLLRQNGRTLRRIEALEAPNPLAGSRINRNGLTPGTPAPAFTLPRLDGGELSLSDYAGRRVLLVFSDPDCGPCDLLAPRLERLSRQTTDPSVVMVSRGDRERNRQKAAQHGLTFPVVVQEHWKLSREYAKFATPIAYLIDERGRIAADVAMGVDAIMQLATKEKSLG